MTFSIDLIGWPAETSAWIETIFAITVRTAIVILAALVLGVILRRAAARVRYALWVSTLLAVVAVPVLMYAGPSWTAPILPDLQVNVVDASATAAPFDVNGTRDRSIRRPSSAARRGDAVAPAVAPLAPRSIWPLVIAAIWFVGALVPLAWLLVGLIRIASITRSSEPLGGQSWNALIAELRLHGTLPGRVRLRISESIRTPMTWGVLRPVILMPAESAEWPDERRRVVLLHELVHVRRIDWPVQVLAQLMTAAMWYNPLAWLAVRRLELEREHSCDGAVIALGTQPTVYASHLLDIARHMRSHTASATATLAMARQSQLEGRLVSILNGTTNRRGAGLLVVAPLAMVLLTGAVSSVRGSTMAIHPPEDISAIRFNPEIAQLHFELMDLYDAMEPTLIRLESLEEEKAPLYAEQEAIDAELAALTAPVADAAEEARRAVQRTGLEARRQEVDATLDPLVERWHSLYSELEPRFERQEEVFGRMYDALDVELQDIIESEYALLAAPVPEEVGRVRDEIVAEAILVLQEQCELSIDESYVWLEVAPERVRRDMRRVFASAVEGSPRAFENVDRDDLDAAIDRLVHVVSSLRFVLEL